MYCGNSRIGGRSKIRLITYRCNNRASRTSISCRNKEINRDYVERFVLEALSEIIFDDEYIPKILAGYNTYIQEHSLEKQNTILRLQGQLNKSIRKIENLANAVAETGNISLISALETQEKIKADLEMKMADIEASMSEITISEDTLQKAFLRAKALFRSGKLEETRQLINLYVDRVTVYTERIDINPNALNFLSESLEFQEKNALTKVSPDAFRIEQSVQRHELYESY